MMLDCVEFSINRDKLYEGLEKVAKKSFTFKGATFYETKMLNELWIKFYIANQLYGLKIEFDENVDYNSKTNSICLNISLNRAGESRDLIFNDLDFDLDNFVTYAQIMNYIYDEININTIKEASVKEAYRLPEKVKTFEKSIQKYGLGFNDETQTFFYYKINELGNYTTEIGKKFNGNTPMISLQNAISSEEEMRTSIIDKMKLHRELLEDIVRYNSKPTINLEKYINRKARVPERKAINEKIETLLSIDKINDEYAYKKAYSSLQDAVENALNIWESQLKALAGRRRFTMGLSAQITKNPNFFQDLFGIESEHEDKPIADADTVNKIKKAIMGKQQISFMYRKQSGEEREVNMIPKGFTSGSEGQMVAGFDVDRNASRKFFINNIITMK